MKRSYRLFVWILNSSANLASWTIDVLARNIQLFMNVTLTIFIGTVLYSLLRVIKTPQPFPLLIALFFMTGCFVIFEIADSFVWLMLPTKYYGRFLMSLIRLRSYTRGNSIILIASVLIGILQILEGLLRPFNQSMAASIHTLTSDLRKLGNTLRANEFAKLQAI